MGLVVVALIIGLVASDLVGLLQRAIYGQYHHVSDKHLHRYLSEREFVYNGRDLTDGERFAMAIKAADGKRLRYRQQTGRE